MNPTASIIIPTWNNPQYLDPCLESIAKTGALNGLCELIVVNNGNQPMEHLKDWPNTKVLKPRTNLGWEGGLDLGLKEARGEFICFQNDDTLIPKASQNFYSQLLWPFQNQKVAAVGPATTIASGWHSIFMRNNLRTLTDVTYLIFFTVMIRKSDLLAAGGIDTSAPGGDDFDLSIRLRKLGKNLVINPDAFLIHHAFKTGERVNGGPDKPSGWNSKEMIDRTNQWLIQKHGFTIYLETIRGFSYMQGHPAPDSEGDVVRAMVRGPKIIELGCGARKTVPQAVGIDHMAKGEIPSNLNDGSRCVADIQSDVSKPLPVDPLSIDTVIARHILEHIVDTIETIRNWGHMLKIGGRMIIAVPNQDIINSIPLNPEHVHAFTPQSLKQLMQACGFKELEVIDPKNGISFVACFEKMIHVEQFSDGSSLEVAHA